MTTQTGQRLTLAITSSRWLALFVVATHLAAMAVAVAVAVTSDADLALLLLLPVAAGLYRSWRMRVSLTAGSAIRLLEWQADGGWVVTDTAGRSLPGRLLKRSFVAPWLTILSFSLGGLTRRHVLLLPDNADPGQVRRLRVRLRLGAR